MEGCRSSHSNTKCVPTPVITTPDASPKGAKIRALRCLCKNVCLKQSSSKLFSSPIFSWGDLSGIVRVPAVPHYPHQLEAFVLQFFSQRYVRALDWPTKSYKRFQVHQFDRQDPGGGIDFHRLPMLITLHIPFCRDFTQRMTTGITKINTPPRSLALCSATRKPTISPTGL